MDNEFKLKTEPYCFRHDCYLDENHECSFCVAEDNDAKTQLGFLVRDITPLVRAVRDGFTTDRGTSDLDDEQPIHVCIPLGEYRRAVRLLEEARDGDLTNCVRSGFNCADELAPILAGLRALRNKMQRRARVDTDPANGSAALQARGRVEGEFAKELDALLGQPATAGAGGEQET